MEITHTQGENILYLIFMHIFTHYTDKNNMTLYTPSNI